MEQRDAVVQLLRRMADTVTSKAVVCKVERAWSTTAHR